MNKYILFLLSLFLVVLRRDVLGLERKAKSLLEFTILHNNDMHGRFEEVNEQGLACTEDERQQNLCFGGFARIAHVVRKYRTESRSSGVPVLFLNAGDTYTGTPWYSLYKHKIVLDFLNNLRPDAVALGSHEFDDGLSGLMPLLSGAKFPVLSSNFKTDVDFTFAKQLSRSIVFTIQGTRVGVIGYITPDTKNLVAGTSLAFLPEIPAINAEASKLKEAGVNIIIALGHSGFRKDKEIALKCQDVDIVIGGLSKTFLYTGTPPSIEKPEGPYPYIVKRDNGQKVPVLQAFGLTKYMGVLKVQFDTKGHLLAYEGAPILLNSSIQQEPDILRLLEKYRQGFQQLKGSIVAQTKVYLEGSAEFCRKEECNLGNLIADAMVHARANQYNGRDPWTDAAAAILNAGSIRGSINVANNGTITEEDLLKVLPFNDKLFMVELPGKCIVEVLENSIYAWLRKGNGGFLQVSGFHIGYDPYRNAGSRIAFVEIRCAQCPIPRYEPLILGQRYRIIVPSFLLNQGDNYDFNHGNITQKSLNMSDIEALRLYLKDRRIVYTGLEERINFVSYEIQKKSLSAAPSHRARITLFTLACYAFRSNLFPNIVVQKLYLPSVSLKEQGCIFKQRKYLKKINLLRFVFIICNRGL